MRLYHEYAEKSKEGPRVHFMVLVNNIWVDPTNNVQLP